MFLWTDQDVSRRLRLNVLESEKIIVLVDDPGRYFFSCNSAEQAVIHYRAPLCRSSSLMSRMYAGPEARTLCHLRTFDKLNSISNSNERPAMPLPFNSCRGHLARPTALRTS